MKVGDVVPISRRPGRAKVVRVNLPALRVTVETNSGEIELSLQDLFPQTGPFARHPAKAQPKRRKDQTSRAPEPDRPMHRRSSDSRAAKKNREALLAIKPGEQVFVLPFNKRATLIRIRPEKDLAIVQSGIFEMELPLADLEPLDSKR